jgi:hypothetical protein
MKRFLLTLMGVVSILLVLSSVGCCQQCDPLTGLCFLPNREASKLVSVQSEPIPMEPAPLESNLSSHGDPMLIEEVPAEATVRRRFYSGRSCTPVRSLLVGSSQRIKRLRCR